MHVRMAWERGGGGGVAAGVLGIAALGVDHDLDAVGGEDFEGGGEGGVGEGVGVLSEEERAGDGLGLAIVCRRWPG